MNRRSILPNHYGYNVFNPVTIDIDGPFGLGVCQPSTVPRPFVGEQNLSSNSSTFQAASHNIPNHKKLSPSIEKEMNNLQSFDEVEEIYAECGENCGSSVTSPEPHYVSRKCPPCHAHLPRYIVTHQTHVGGPSLLTCSTASPT
eukprot:TRINITY_DN36268_c0_g1_i1.p1 TRINITY_DN36268_c0_g1~~TRINITY_DN36268_c0_g1_i1.p1  ORF type:complete len:144 (-),score=19.18 TRINITY_DN36268_c0_g1_i1:116-547(-)